MVNKGVVKGKIATKVPKKSADKVPKKDVGARNPYAMVEQKLGVKIDWARTPLENRKKIIKKILKIPYEKLFSPESGSPVYTIIHNSKRGPKP
jgi:hypothetical protein